MTSTTAQQLTVAILSFNRGRYLQHLCETLSTNLSGAKVVIYDDASDDPETVAFLQSCPYPVVSSEQKSSGRHGNLYRNMQCAFQQCQTRFLLFLQDDTQIVRKVDDRDFEDIQRIFDDPTIAFLRPHFLKQAHARRFIESTEHIRELNILKPINSFQAVEPGNAYCDVVLCDVPKLRAVDWQFREIERQNQLQAQRLFSAMPFMWNPFVFYCPEVPSYRDRKLYLASRLVQRRRKGQIAVFRPIEGAALTTFLSRPDTAWPIAEDFLTTNLPDVVRPFVFQDYAKSPWLHALYKVESRLWRMALPFIRLFKRSG